MRKTFIILSVILLLGGCFSAPAKKYFQLSLGDMKAPSTKTLDKTLSVERIEVEELYDDFRIVYRLSPYEVNYYSYDFWAEKPSRLIRDSLFHFLSEGRLFKTLTLESIKSEPDFALKTRIYRIEEVDEKHAWFARLAMDLEIIDFKSGETIAVRRFDRSEALASKDVAELPAAVSKILREELEKLIQEIIAKN
jgi:ABC-type uncharacterized transport system auxiliary subunit